MTAPPLFAAGTAVQVTVSCPLPGVTTTPVGAAGATALTVTDTVRKSDAAGNASSVTV